MTVRAHTRAGTTGWQQGAPYHVGRLREKVLTIAIQTIAIQTIAIQTIAIRDHRDGDER
jgi:hypothetical protein